MGITDTGWSVTLLLAFVAATSTQEVQFIDLTAAPQHIAIRLLTSSTQLQDSTAGDKVAAIVDRILRRGEGSVGNIKTSRWVPPSPEDIEQIREIGQNAIPQLDRALDSHRPFEPLLAVRLLETIGGANIVSPLKRALGSDRANSVRIAALWALRSAPDDLAVPIIQSTVRDPDPLVARHAKDVLTNYYQVEVPK
jgi:hypothetical protein